MSGEFWLGLEKLHQLTSEGNFSLRITMKDFDDETYVAIYNQFQVIEMLCNNDDAINESPNNENNDDDEDDDVEME